MKSWKLGLAVIAVAALSACNNSKPSAGDGAAAADWLIRQYQLPATSVTVEQGSNSVQLSASGNTRSLQVGSGDSTVVIGDIQQTQDGVGKTEVVSIGAVPAGVAALATGDGRSVTVENGQMVLHREGVGTVIIPEAR